MAENAYNSSPKPPEKRSRRSISQLGLQRYGIHSHSSTIIGIELSEQILLEILSLSGLESNKTRECGLNVRIGKCGGCYERVFLK